MSDNRTEPRSRNCHGIDLRRASNAVTEYYNKMLAPSGLTLNQYCIINNIAKNSPCSISDLATMVRLERTTLVRTLKPLFSAGYIQDMALPGQRNHQLQLTKSGLGHLEQAVPLWKKAQETIERYIGEEKLAVFTDLLNQLEEI